MARLLETATESLRSVDVDVVTLDLVENALRCTPAGGSVTRLTPNFVSPHASPSSRFTRAPIRERNGSG